jgi:hypothetical protein
VVALVVLALGAGAAFAASRGGDSDDPAGGTTSTPSTVDVKGPCDEAEHANDPECAGAQVPEDNDAVAPGDDEGPNHDAKDDNGQAEDRDDNSGPGNAQDDDADEDNSGPSASSGPGNAGVDDNSGSGSGEDGGHSGHGGGGDDD